VQVDGADFTDNSVNAARTTVSQEAVQEYQVATNSYAPEFGRATGGIVNVVTKRGGNEYRGNVFGFIRDKSIQARNPFSPVDKPDFHTATIALLCRALGGPPYSFTAHGPEEFERADLLSIAEKSRHAAFVAVVSEAGRTHLRQLCPPNIRERIHLVRCGVDARFATHPPTPIPPARQIVFVGRLCAEKAPLLLVEAMAQLNATGKACDLVMIGDGPLRPSVESRIRALHLADRISLVGWASSDDVKRHILASRALVLPSFAEGLPIVLMEALALQRPVICTTVGGVAELVEPGVCGWLIPPGSVDALVQAMGDMLHAPPSELERMGRQGAARVAQQHDPAVAGRLLAALFARTLTRPCEE
jgi:glycosyltransferase involved in cell wall biosynthesis